MSYFFPQFTNNEKLLEEPVVHESPPHGALWIVPLGGLGEIGKNLCVMETEKEILVIDAGLMFPNEDMPGVDYVIPDIRYLIHKKEKISGIILTHGHEDHIGALPYLIPQLSAPLYGTRLTIELVRSKLREYGDLATTTKLVTVSPGDVLTFESFSVRFFSVIHSICEGVGLIIDTPAGRVVHSGDFKFDTALQNGSVADFLTLAGLGEEKVTVLMSDSTYAEKPGFSVPERVVVETLDRVFQSCRGRIIVSTFASSIPRIQQIMNLASRHGRKVCIHGKGLEMNLAIAQEFGYLTYPEGTVVRIEDTKRIADEKLLILATGSQGEPLSALTLMATDCHKWVKIKKGDTVIISATPVPGNETLVHNNINALFRLGAEVIYENPYRTAESDQEAFHVHASGHGSREELKLLITLVKPEYFIPIHGEIRHLIFHARLAEEMGIREDHIFMIEDGTILELTREGLRVLTILPMADILVDGFGVGDVGPSVLKDRMIMAQNGVCFMSATVDPDGAFIVEGPCIETRGLVYEKESQELLDEARGLAEAALEENLGKMPSEELPAAVKSVLKRFFYQKTKRRPIIVPLIISSKDGTEWK
ncbi:MAG: ribonuclease J [Candidatus Eremiobacteraeota bacterium]|nr:ribonuclease J [Candidatus Eremiobacteraeota bacterium]